MPKEKAQAVPQQEPQRAADPLESKVQAAVDKWYADRMHNSVVSRDTDVHNLIHEAKPALVQAVLAAVAQTNPQE